MRPSTRTPRTVRLLCAAIVATLVIPTTWASAGSRPGAPNKAHPRVVVAVIDSGINAYHEYFHAGGPLYRDRVPSSVTPAVLREFGIDKDHIIRVTRTGNFATDFKKDADQWRDIEAGEPYWFAGTNIIGISFGSAPHLSPAGSASAHGIGTAAAVLIANPEAIVVAVEDINTDSERWAFTNPAVDIVTTSYGPITSVPTLNHLSNSYTGVVKNGKAHFGAAANDPTYSSLDETSGPWWSIGVAGFEEGSSGGRQLASGNVPDFVGDWTQELPYCRSCEKGLESVSGTSFATPRSAGTFSRILLETRRASNHPGGIVKSGKKMLLVDGKHSFTVWEMRRALEESAYYPGIGDYGGQSDPDVGSVPVIDAAPWFQTGWGLISPDLRYDVIKETLAHLGVTGKAKRSKPQPACDFMTANMEARHTYWDRVAAMGESYGTSEDPYIYC